MMGINALYFICMNDARVATRPHSSDKARQLLALYRWRSYSCVRRKLAFVIELRLDGTVSRQRWIVAPFIDPSGN